MFDADDYEQTAVIALDADRGEKLWRKDTHVERRVSPITATDELLYLEAPDVDGGSELYIYCLDPDDGSIC